MLKLKLKKSRAVIHRSQVISHFDSESSHRAADFQLLLKDDDSEEVSVAAHLKQEILLLCSAFKR